MIDLINLLAITGLWGGGTSWLLEQAPWFDKLPSGGRKSANLLVNLLAPLLVVLLQPHWIEGMGNLNEFAGTLAIVLVPLATMIWSQIAHALNPQRKVTKPVATKRK